MNAPKPGEKVLWRFFGAQLRPRTLARGTRVDVDARQEMTAERAESWAQALADRGRGPVVLWQQDGRRLPTYRFHATFWPR